MAALVQAKLVHGRCSEPCLLTSDERYGRRHRGDDSIQLECTGRRSDNEDLVGTLEASPWAPHQNNSQALPMLRFEKLGKR